MGIVNWANQLDKLQCKRFAELHAIKLTKYQHVVRSCICFHSMNVSGYIQTLTATLLPKELLWLRRKAGGAEWPHSPYHCLWWLSLPQSFQVQALAWFYLDRIKSRKQALQKQRYTDSKVTDGKNVRASTSGEKHHHHTNFCCMFMTHLKGSEQNPGVADIPVRT